MASNEVIIHNNDRIHNLMCGNKPYVGSTTSKQKADVNIFKDNTDFSKIPFPDPIEPSRFQKSNDYGMNDSALNESYGSEPKSKMKEFNKLKDDESMIRNIDRYLSLYDINSKRKKMLLHQDLENHYFQPLSNKLVKKTSGKEYENYLKAKSRAVTAFDNQVRKNDTFSKELPKIPTLKFDSSDLTDPIIKYKYNAREEKKLTRLIQKSTGELEKTESFPERDTLNLKKYKILTETRFFDGNDNSNSTITSKGKKIDPNKFNSNIAPYIDNFAPPIDRPSYVGRKKQDYQIDHIKFDQ